MRTEAILAAVALAAALLPLLIALVRARSFVGLAIGLVFWLGSPAALLLYGAKALPPAPAPVEDRPVEVEEDGYVTSETCGACHPGEHASWHASFHRTMTQVATPETVLAPFDGREVSFYGWRIRLDRAGEEFRMRIGGSAPGAKTGVSRHIVLTTGSHHMQKYWYATGNGRELGLAPLVYLIEDETWVPEHTAFLRPPERGLPIREGNWNRGCNQCHATAAKPRLLGPDRVDTTVAEFGIACEACHGASQAHIRANRDPLRRYRLHLSDSADDTVVNPSRLSAERSSEVCGQCHGAFLLRSDEAERWKERGHSYRPGDDLQAFRHYVRRGDDPELFEELRAESSFWPDGTIRVAGREYNGLLSSPCYTHGGPDRTVMSCLSCHVLHRSPDDPRTLREWRNDQLGHGMESNEACLQCHEAFRGNVAEHSHHPEGSAGNLCYNCHMPYTTYGLLKAIRSHTIESPAVATSLETGRPNACNQCHLDRTLAWTAEHLESWYGQPEPTLDDDERTVAASILWSLRGDAAQRALMAWSLGWDAAREASGTDWMVFYLVNLMFDPYDAVRQIAYRSLRSTPGYEAIRYDPIHPEPFYETIVPQVQRIFYDRARSTGFTRGATLLDEAGNLDAQTYERLSRQRDDRPVVIKE